MNAGDAAAQIGAIEQTADDGATALVSQDRMGLLLDTSALLSGFSDVHGGTLPPSLLHHAELPGSIGIGMPAASHALNSFQSITDRGGGLNRSRSGSDMMGSGVRISPTDLSMELVTSRASPLHPQPFSLRGTPTAYPLFNSDDTAFTDWIPHVASYVLSPDLDEPQYSSAAGSPVPVMARHWRDAYSDNPRSFPGRDSTDAGAMNTLSVTSGRSSDAFGDQSSSDAGNRTPVDASMVFGSRNEKGSISVTNPEEGGASADPSSDALTLSGSHVPGAGRVASAYSTATAQRGHPAARVRTVSSHGEPPALPVEAIQPGTDLNKPPPNWLQRDNVHFAHLSAPSRPVTGSLGMVDMCTDMMEHSSSQLEYENMFPPFLAEENGEWVPGNTGSGRFASAPPAPNAIASTKESERQMDRAGLAGAKPASETVSAADSNVSTSGPTAMKPQRNALRHGTSDARETAAAATMVNPHSSASAENAKRNDALPPPPLRKAPDIISRVDDMKKLIMSPYTSTPLHFMVHRVGPSVVIEGALPNRSHTVADARSKTLQSKLLYYSILTDDDGSVPLEFDRIPSPHPMNRKKHTEAGSTKKSPVPGGAAVPPIVKEAIDKGSGYSRSNSGATHSARECDADSRVSIDAHETRRGAARALPPTGETEQGNRRCFPRDWSEYSIHESSSDDDDNDASNPDDDRRADGIQVLGTTHTYHVDDDVSHANRAVTRIVDDGICDSRSSSSASVNRSVCSLAPSSAHSTASESLSPPPEPSTATADPAFRQVLHWRFDNLHLLLGSNSPVYKNPITKESLTLRVKQHASPSTNMASRDPDAVTVECDTTDAASSCPNNLTSTISKHEALDLWLENIMTNVDGVAICFHSDGTVQGYQIVSTQDLPNFGTDSFEPIAVQRNASHIMHWLTRCCATTGSYVLVRNANESVLRLYNLSPLYSSAADAASQSPAYYKTWDAYQKSTQLPRTEEKSPVKQKAGRECHDSSASMTKALPTTPAATSTTTTTARSDQHTPLLIAGPPPQIQARVDAIDESLDLTEREEQQKTFRRQLNSAASMSIERPLVDMSVAPPAQAPTLDSPSGLNSGELEKHQKSNLNAFRYPMGMMCLRMAGALPNSDAETLRLLERAICMFDEDDPRTFLPLALAHAQCMAHYHSSSPLIEAEAECLRHGRAAINLVGRHHFYALMDISSATHYTEEEARNDVESHVIHADRKHSKHKDPRAAQIQRRLKAMALFDSLEEEEDRISGVVLRCMCAITQDSVSKGKMAHAIEPLSIAQDALWLRERNLPRQLLTAGESANANETRAPFSSGSSTTTPGAAPSAPSQQQQQQPQPQPQPLQRSVLRNLRRNREAAAAAFQLETILGDIHSHLARSYDALRKATPSYNPPTDKFEDPLFDEHCRLQVLALSRQSMVPSDTSFNYVLRLMPFSSSSAEHVEVAKEAYARAVQFAPLCHARVVELQQKRAALLTLQAAAELENIARLEAPGTAQQRRCTVAAKTEDAASASAELSPLLTARIVSATKEALGYYKEARLLFQDVMDRQNAAMMAINEAKMALRLAKLYCDEKPSVLSHEEAVHLHCAVDTLARAVRWLEDVQVKQAVPSAINAHETVKMLSGTAVSVFLLVAQRALSAAPSLCTPSPPRQAKSQSQSSSDAQPAAECETSPLNALFGLGSRTSSHTLADVASGSPLKCVERLVHDKLLQPALRLARSVNVSAEYHVLEMTIDMHMQCAGITHPLPELRPPHVPKFTLADYANSASKSSAGAAAEPSPMNATDAEKVESAKWFISRCRQMLSLMAASGQLPALPAAPLSQNLALASPFVSLLYNALTLSGYTFLLQHARSLTIQASGENDASNADAAGSLDASVFGDSNDDAALDVVERAATTLYATLPAVHEYATTATSSSSAASESPTSASASKSKQGANRGAKEKKHTGIPGVAKNDCKLDAGSSARSCSAEELRAVLVLAATLMSATGRTMMTLLRVMGSQQKSPYVERKRSLLKTCASDALRVQADANSMVGSISTEAASTATASSNAATVAHGCSAILLRVEGVLEQVGDAFDRKRKKQQSRFL